MIIIFIIICITFSQNLTHQTKKSNKMNYDLTNDRFECNNNKTNDFESICKNCKAKHFYLLDEQNWLIIGVTHGFGKEYKILIESLRNHFIDSKIYSTFNSDYICLLIIESQINLEGFLQEFQIIKFPKTFLPLPKCKDYNLQFFSNFTEIDFKYENNEQNFKITNFNFIGKAQTQGLYKNTQLIIKNLNQITIMREGLFEVLNEQNSFTLRQLKDKNNIQEEINMKLESDGIAFKQFLQENYSKFYSNWLLIQDRQQDQINFTIIKQTNKSKNKISLNYRSND